MRKIGPMRDELEKADRVAEETIRAITTVAANAHRDRAELSDVALHPVRYHFLLVSQHGRLAVMEDRRLPALPGVSRYMVIHSPWAPLRVHECRSVSETELAAFCRGQWTTKKVPGWTVDI